MAGRADHGAAAGDQTVDKWCGAGLAGLVVPAIDVVAGLEPAGLAIGVDVVSEAGAAGSDRPLQQGRYGMGQGFGVALGEAVGSGQWAETGLEQQLIDVDVAQARDEGLI